MITIHTDASAKGWGNVTKDSPQKKANKRSAPHNCNSNLHKESTKNNHTYLDQQQSSCHIS